MYWHTPYLTRQFIDCGHFVETVIRDQLGIEDSFPRTLHDCKLNSGLILTEIPKRLYKIEDGIVRNYSLALMNIDSIGNHVGLWCVTTREKLVVHYMPPKGLFIHSERALKFLGIRVIDSFDWTENKR